MSEPALHIGVLAVQGDVREHLEVLRSLGVRASGVRRPSELAEVDALVLPGGESTTMDKLLRAFELYEPVRERISAGMPAYGSCAGMILLADRIADGRPDQQTLGGLDITVRRNAFGRQVDSFEEDLHVPALQDVGQLDGTPGDGLVRAVFIRAPWVEELGERATALASVEHGPAAGRVVAVQQGPLLATSFHPEMTGDRRFHAYFVRLARDAVAAGGAERRRVF